MLRSVSIIHLFFWCKWSDFWVKSEKCQTKITYLMLFKVFVLQDKLTETNVKWLLNKINSNTWVLFVVLTLTCKLKKYKHEYNFLTNQDICTLCNYSSGIGFINVVHVLPKWTYDLPHIIYIIHLVFVTNKVIKFHPLIILYTISKQLL